MRLETPKISLFNTLISKHCVNTEKISDYITFYYISVPDPFSIIVLECERGKTHNRYTFHTADQHVIRRCFELNTRLVKIEAAIEVLKSDCIVSIVRVNLEIGQVIIDVTLEGVSTLYFALNKNELFSMGKTDRITELPLNCVQLRAAFPNATGIECYSGRNTKMVSSSSAKAILGHLGSMDIGIINNVWRYGSMNTNYEFFSAEEIVIHTLYLGAGSCEAEPFAMLCAFELEPEDTELFRPAFYLGRCVYTAIGRENLSQKIVVDEKIFLKIIRENPSCASVMKLYGELSEKRFRTVQLTRPRRY